MVNPSELAAGETLRLTTPATLPDGFKAVACLAYLRGPSSADAPGVIDANGDASATFGDTATLSPGLYATELWGTDATGARRILARGSLTIRASLAAAPANFDPRTDAARALAAIRTMLAGTATQGVKSYTINNRTLDRYSMGELLSLEKHYALIVARENRTARGVSTLGPRIAVRL